MTLSLGSVWRDLPDAIRLPLLLLTLPGAVAHEITHALVARPFAQSIQFRWDEIAVVIVWRDDRRWPRVAALLAPLANGYIVGVAVVVVVLLADLSVNGLVLAYGAVQWVLYVWGSVRDVVAALAIRIG